MNRERRALQLFEEALELPPDELAVFLEGACVGDNRLRYQVESLLGAVEESEKLLPDRPTESESTLATTNEETIRAAAASDNLRLQPSFVLADRYTIVETIGVGGMGEVYRAKDARLDRLVAIKVLNVASLDDASMHERFDREIKSVASLSHPNIVTLHDVSSDADIKFAVMEFVAGKTLRQLIADDLDWPTAVKLAHGVASGLSSAHSRNIMHRDIKPENIIVSDEGHAKILDFGLARPETRNINQDLTAVASMVPGTVPYMSPEQAESQKVACSTDIFSLGTVLFEMLTGTNPFRADTAFQTMRNVSAANPPKLASLIDDVPSELTSLIMAMLERQPGLRPTAADVVYQLNILQRRSAAAKSPVSALHTDFLSTTPTPTNLPRHQGELTGRDEEIQHATAQLGEHPIVTLIGPGGVGKTSLALEVARQALDKFPGGAWLCEFGSVRDAKDVLEVLTAALDGNAGSMGELDQIVVRLQAQPTLLMFDNCEHVIDSVADLAEILSQRVVHLKILATSRESLNVPKERVCRLEGLQCNGSHSSAAELFVKRASSSSEFKDTPNRRRLVEQIVTRLEGLPLAIELAAPQLVAMSLEELLEALDDQMSTLRSSRRSQNRQSTVSQTIAWSFDLLEPKEQEVLLALSVFAGAFTLEAGLKVCDVTTGGRRRLQRLVEQSMLVRTEHKGLSRFRLLEPIRQFCQSRIDPELLVETRRRQAWFFADRAAVLGQGIYGVNEKEAADALNFEWPDLRKAIAWGREHSILEVAVDPIVALTRTAMFQLRVEAFQWMIDAVEQFGIEVASRADVQYVIGTGMWIKGDKQQAQVYLDRSDTLGPYAPNQYMQYSQLFSQNRFLEALEVIEKGRQIARDCGDELENRWLSLPFAANTLTMVDPNDPRIDQSLASLSPQIAELDWPTGKAYLLMIQGTVAMTRGDLMSAKQAMNQSIAMSTSCGNRALATLVGMIVDGFSDASIPAQQRLESAVCNLQVMIETGVKTGDASAYPLAVRSTIMAMVGCGQLEVAARCSGMLSALKGSGDQNELSPEFLPTMRHVAETLGREQFARLQRVGAHLTVSDIADLGEETLNHLTTTTVQSPADPGKIVIAKKPSILVPPQDDPATIASLPEQRPSIAVLPLQTHSVDASHDFYGEAVAQEIIVELSRLRWLPVIARGSSFQFHGSNANLSEAARVLGAKYLLGGSLAIHAGRAVLSVELCSAPDMNVVWAERFEAKPDDVLQFRFAVSTQIVGAVEASIQRSEAEQAIRQPTENLDAWSAYHRGLIHMYRFNARDNEVATDLFRHAVQQDPYFARAHAGLSFTHFQNAFLKLTGNLGEHRANARRCAEKSAELDPLDPFVNLTLGRASWLENDLETAGAWLDQALQLNPSYSFARYNRALIDVMFAKGEACEENVNQAIRLSPIDPLSYAMYSTRALSHIIRSDYEQALGFTEQAMRQPTAHVHIFAIAAMAYELAGKPERAQELARLVQQKSPTYTQQDFFRSFPFREGEATIRMSEAFGRLGI